MNNTYIPKQIFYVWGVNEPLKENVKKYIDTWKKYLSDYKIIQIDESSIEYFNFQEELKNNKWFKTVYEKKMWAYVADYVRIKTLYTNGGIYFDTDVEVLQPFDDMLNEPAFVGMQDSSIDGNRNCVEPAILGARKKNKLLEKILLFYDKLIWEKPIYTMPQIFDYYLKEYQIYPFPERNKQSIIKLEDITIYPEKFFIPFRGYETFNKKCLKSETHTIHWWNGSWKSAEILFFLRNKHNKTIEEIQESYNRNKTAIIRMIKVEQLWMNKKKSINEFGKH